MSAETRGTSESARPAAPPPPGALDLRSAMTVGLGLRGNPKARRIRLHGDVRGQIQETLHGHVGDEAWASPHVWQEDRRAKSRWEASIGVFVDLDCEEHGVLDPGLGARAVDALRDHANLAYFTPHGLRAIFVFTESVRDADRFQRVAAGACALVASELAAAGVEGLDVDKASIDIARAFYAPNAVVACKRKHAECSDPERRAPVESLRESLWKPEELELHAPEKKLTEARVGKRRRASHSLAGPADLVAALLSEEGEQRGDDIVFRCSLPRHADVHPSARYNVAKECWYCDVCEEGGGWVGLARQRGLKVSTQRKQKNGSGQQVPPPAPAPPGGDQGDKRPTIRFKIWDDYVPLSQIVPEAIGALAERLPDELFCRGGMLVRVITEQAPRESSGNEEPGAERGRLRIQELPEPALRLSLDKAARWQNCKVTKHGAVDFEDLCPRAVVAAVRAAGRWEGIRPLSGVVEAPTMRPDGSVLAKAGYDDATALIYTPRRDYPEVSEQPSEEEVASSVETLLAPFDEFTLETGADRTSLLALLLTVAARPAIGGPTPHWLVLAPSFGAGKTLLCEAISIAMTGVEPVCMAPVGGRPADADAEMRKRITALLLSAPRVAVIDNLDDGQTFESKSFATVLTSTRWTDRILGKSEDAVLQNNTVWISTGCNVRLWGDLARRSLSILIDPGVEDPHRRSFEIEDLCKHVRDHHPELLVAALTILRGYFSKGRPRHGLPMLGKFEAWDRLVRGATIWATSLTGASADPLDTAARLQDESPDRSGLANLLGAWASAAVGRGALTVQQAKELAVHDEALREAIEEVGVGLDGSFSPTKLGKYLSTHQGRVVDGMRLEQAGKLQRRVLWRVVGLPGREGGEVGEDDAVSPSFSRACPPVCVRIHEEQVSRITSQTSPPSPSELPPSTPSSFASAEKLAEPGSMRRSAAQAKRPAGPRQCSCGGKAYHQLVGAPLWICSVCHPAQLGQEIAASAELGIDSQESS